MSIFTNRSDRAADEASGYVAAVLALVGERDPIEVLEELAEELTEIAASMTPAELAMHEAPGKWSGVELLAHLADSELVWAFRLRITLAEADPVLTGYDQDRWVDKLGYRHRDPKTSLEEIAFLRRMNLRLIRRLTEEELDRSARHSERGTESARHMIRLYAGHDLVHRAQFERIRMTVQGRA